MAAFHPLQTQPVGNNRYRKIARTKGNKAIERSPNDPLSFKGGNFRSNPKQTLVRVTRAPSQKFVKRGELATHPQSLASVAEHLLKTPIVPQPVEIGIDFGVTDMRYA